MGDKLVIKNISNTDFTVQGILISQGSTYTVPDANIVSFAQDGYLMILVFQNLMDVVSYSYDLGANSAQWLSLIARGTVVLS